MRKIFLEDLPMNKNGTIRWKDSVGCMVRFEYDNISGVINIIGYDNSKYHIIAKYKDRERSIFIGSFKECMIQDLIGLRHSEYYYNVGDIIHNTYLVKEQTKIPHAKTRKSNAKSRSGMNKAYVVECLRCGFNFTIGEGIIRQNTQEDYCAVCSKYPKFAVKGKTDLWTTNPEIAQMLENPDDGYTHLKASNDKTDWICPICNTVIRNRSFAQVYYHGLACKKCGDGVSYPEKIMRECLEQSGLNFEMHKIFDWSNLKEYDFYIPDYNIIIETHGIQHYKQSFERIGGVNLEEVQLNDAYKEKLAIQNGIIKYIVIDCSVSDFNYIYTNIKKSELNTIINFNAMDEALINKNSLTSYFIRACEMWNSGIKDVNKIAEIINVSPYTIASYLKRGYKAGLCDYTKYMKSKSQRPIKCKTTNEIFESMAAARNKYNVSVNTMRISCLYPHRSAGKLSDGTKLYWEYI